MTVGHCLDIDPTSSFLNVAMTEKVRLRMTVSPAWQIESKGPEPLLRLSGDWLLDDGGLQVSNDVQQVVADLGGSTRLRVDSTAVARWDSSLLAFIWLFLETSNQAQSHFDLDATGLPAPPRRLLSLALSDHRESQATAQTIVRRWSRLTGTWLQLIASAELIGMTAQSILPGLRGRTASRTSDIVGLMRESGAGALGIVAIVNSLVGGILAFVGAQQLKRFGAGIYITDLLGVAVIREMAPIMTAIVMAGRTGGAYAAQIATMEGNEEIDALRVFGIPPFQYLVFPRIVALVAMMPLLYFYACLIGLAGGLMVSFLVLDMPSTMLLDELRSAVQPVQFQIGLAKSVCFGAFLALAGCHVGLSAGRSAADVGRAATGAVVVGIIGIIALDAVFAACANVLGI
jgi:phospholipid/cholesterol/gamma-HCH transport system permease protein